MTSPQVFLRPLANPLPLGFLALAAATLLVSGLHVLAGRFSWLEQGIVEPAEHRRDALT